MCELPSPQNEGLASYICDQLLGGGTVIKYQHFFATPGSGSCGNEVLLHEVPLWKII